jgi:hypothetical protein
MDGGIDALKMWLILFGFFEEIRLERGLFHQTKKKTKFFQWVILSEEIVCMYLMDDRKGEKFTEAGLLLKRENDDLFPSSPPLDFYFEFSENDNLFISRDLHSKMFGILPFFQAFFDL